MPTRLLLLAAAFALIAGCAAPRAVIWDGSSVERWHVQGHAGMVGVVPTATLSAAGQAQLDAAKGILGDSLLDSTTLRNSARTLVAASLDMPGMNTVLSAHMGLGWGLEAGYRREGGANAWSLRWQFLSAKKAGVNGGIGVMYSSLEYEVPSVLGDVQKALGYEFKRKDVSIPVVFSKPLGDGGEYGSVGGGLVGAWTSTQYGFDPEGFYKSVVNASGKSTPLDKLPDQKTSFLSYGGVIFGKFGFKRVWLMTGVTMLYQDYGSYQVPGTDPVGLSGLTILPSAGLEFRI